jgi:hypothetical protein
MFNFIRASRLDFLPFSIISSLKTDSENGCLLYYTDTLNYLAICLKVLYDLTGKIISPLYEKNRILAS